MTGHEGRPLVFDELQYAFRDFVGTSALAIESYPDTMPRIGHVAVAPCRVLLRPKTVASLMAALWWIDALIERGYAAPQLILPHMPGGRQDRLNATGDALFTLKSIALEINARALPRVTVIDPHSDVTGALINRCDVIRSHEVALGHLVGAYGAVISPDAGAEKRAGNMARMLGVPLLHGWKVRDVTTGALTGFGLEPTDVDGPVLVVDDICDGGGTFLGLADLLDARGLVADLWTTHGLYTKGTAALRARFRTLYCLDSTDGPRDGVTVISACQRLLETGCL